MFAFGTGEGKKLTETGGDSSGRLELDDYNQTRQTKSVNSRDHVYDFRILKLNYISKNNLIRFRGCRGFGF